MIKHGVIFCAYSYVCLSKTSNNNVWCKEGKWGPADYLTADWMEVFSQGGDMLILYYF